MSDEDFSLLLLLAFAVTIVILVGLLALLDNLY